MRRKRPPLLSFLLRMETLRRVARVVSLLVLDFVGVAAAIFTALMLKAARARQPGRPRRLAGARRHWLAFAYLVTVLLFARVGPVRRPRARGPGCRGSSPRCSRRRSSRWSSRSSTASTSRATTSSTARCSSRSSTSRRCALALRARHAAGCCARPATGAARCSSARASTSRPSRTRCAAAAHAPIDVVGFISLDAAARERAALARARSTTCPTVLADERVDEVIIADPDFPQERGGRARRPVPPARRAPCASRRRRWRS